MFAHQLTTWLLVALAVLVQGCLSDQSSDNGKIDDFALGADHRAAPTHPQSPKNLRDNRDRTSLPSSFPLKVRVGKGKDTFDFTPPRSKNPVMSVQTKRFKGCLIAIKTEIFQLNRYLKVKDEWIKMDDGLSPGHFIKLDAGQALYLSLNIKPASYFTKSQQNRCSKVLRNQKTYLGQLSLKGTSIYLLPAPQSPIVASVSESNPNHSAKIYLTWRLTDQFPELIDENDIPLWLESPIFKMPTQKDGFYYV